MSNQSMTILFRDIIVVFSARFNPTLTSHPSFSLKKPPFFFFGVRFRTHYRCLSRKGFTLIELAIVLVIIGLVLGGILVGKDLIRAAEMRSMFKDIDKIKAAAQTFRLKYNCLPGDCPNATQFWGTDASCPSTPSNVTPKLETCNGDGDGRIGHYPGAWSYYTQEVFRFWQQLGNAELIEGKYSGTPASGDAVFGTVVSGTTVPKASFDNSIGYFVKYLDKSLTDSWFVRGNYGNYITVGAPYPGSSAGYIGFRSLTVQEAYAIDSKFDDGKIGMGAIRANEKMDTMDNNATDVPCEQNGTSSNDPSVPLYGLSYTGIRCNLIFANAF